MCAENVSKSIADYGYHMRDWIEQEMLIPFLSIGGDYNLFWTLTPRTISLFWRAEEIKQKRLINLADSQNYQLGIYMKLAHGSNFDKKCKYPKKPIFQIKEEKEKTKIITQQEKENEKLKLLLLLKNIKPKK